MPLLLETLLETVAGRGPGSAVLDHLVNFGGGAGRLDEVGGAGVAGAGAVVGLPGSDGLAVLIGAAWERYCDGECVLT